VTFVHWTETVTDDSTDSSDERIAEIRTSSENMEDGAASVESVEVVHLSTDASVTLQMEPTEEKTAVKKRKKISKLLIICGYT